MAYQSYRYSGVSYYNQYFLVPHVEHDEVNLPYWVDTWNGGGVRQNVIDFVSSDGTDHDVQIGYNAALVYLPGSRGYAIQLLDSTALLYIHQNVQVDGVVVSDGLVQDYGKLTNLQVNGGKVKVYGTTVSGVQVKGGYLWLEANGNNTSGDSIDLVYTKKDANGHDIDVSGVYYYQGSVGSGTIVTGTGIEYIGYETDDYFATDQGGNSAVEYGASVSSGGQQIIAKYGLASNATIGFGGIQIVSSGGVASGSVVKGGGLVTVSAGGLASNVTLAAGGQLLVSSGGSASHVRGYLAGGSESDGVMVVSAGGSATDVSMASATVVNAGRLNLVSGNVLAGLSVTSGGITNLFGGAQVTGAAAVSPNGNLTVAAGARVWSLVGGSTQTVVFGSAGVTSGNAVSNVTVSSGGILTVSSGASATGTVVNNASFDVQAGATISGTQLLSGTFYVNSGITARGTTVSDGGTQSLQSGGRASGTVLSGTAASRATEVVYSGATTTSATVGAGGTLNVAAGSARYATVNSGGRATVSSGGSATYTTVNGGGTLQVLAGGTASDISVGSGATVMDAGLVRLVGGNVASGITVQAGGNLLVMADSIAVSASIQSGGTATVSQGGLASGTQVTSGTTLSVRGIARSSFVSGQNAQQVVYDGGVTTGTQLYFGALEYLASGAVGSGAMVSFGAQLLVAGVSVSATVVGGGTELVSSGAVASATTVSNGGTLTIQAGGVDSGSVASSGGVEYVLAGASASGTQVAGGVQVVSAGGFAGAAKVSAGGTQVVNGATASAYATKVGPGGTQVVSAGLVSGTTVTGGTQILSGGTALGTVVGSGGRMVVSSGSVAEAFTIGSGGTLRVETATLGSGTVSGGTVEVANAVVPSKLAFIGGTEILLSGVSRSDLELTSGGLRTLAVSSGATAVRIQVSSGGTLVAAGGSVKGTTLLRGGTLDLAGFAYAGDSLASLNAVTDMLTVSAGGRATTVQLVGDYAGEYFHLAPDSSGGTLVTHDATLDPTPVILAGLVQDTGTSSSDKLTNVATLSGTALANRTLTVMEGTTTLGSVLVGTDGTWSLTPTLADGAHTLTFSETNAVGQTGTSTLTYTLDTKAPTLTITADKTHLLTGQTALITFTFSDDPGTNPTAFVNGGVLTTLSGTGLTRTATLVPTPGVKFGTANIRVNAGTYKDAAGNTGGVANAPPLTYDTTVPAAPSTPDLVDAADYGWSHTDNVTSHPSPPFSGTARPGLTIKLYDTDGVTLLGTGVTNNDGEWTVNPTMRLADGTHTLTAIATNAAGDASVRSSGLQVTIDTVAPTLAIASDVRQLRAGQTALVTFTFSEDPGNTFTWDGTTGDVVATGGTLSAISGAGLTRTATFTPAANTNNGTASITVAAGRYTDAADNNGGAGAMPSLTFDTLAPTLAITSNMPKLLVGQTAVITFTFSEDPGTSFTLGDIVVAGGALSGLTSTGAVRTATFTPTAGLNGGVASITVPAAAYTDLAGNNGGAGVTPSLTFDTLAPTLAITSSVPKLLVGQTAVITFAFSEDPGTSFTLGDIVVAGGALSGLTSIGAVRTATFTPTAGTNAGTASITVAAVSYTDAAGNNGGAGATPVLTFDTLPPGAPSVPDLAAASDSGVSSTDNVTNITNSVFTGTAEAGSTVRLYDTDGTTVLGSAVAAGGVWSIASSTLSAGAHTVTARATDVAGNAGALSSGLLVTIDAVAPVVTAALVSDTGALASDRVTGSAALTGTTEANATLVFKSGSSVVGSTTADGQGRWSVTPTVADGTYTLTVLATDLAGNAATSVLPTVTLDTKAPVVTLAVATEVGAVSGSVVTSLPALSGTAEAGGVVTIAKNDGTVLGSTVADSAGAWRYTPPLLDGAYTLTASQTDLAGNTGSATLSFTLDSTVPAVVAALASDTGTSATDGNTRNATLTGTADANRLVTLSNGGTVLGTVLSDAQGRWTYAPSLADGRYTLTATETNLAGKTGTATVQFTLDTMAPAVAITSAGGAVSQVQQVVTGTAEAAQVGRIVQVLDGGLVIGTALVQADGSWLSSVVLAQNGAQDVTAQVTDRAGNLGTSAAVTYTLSDPATTRHASQSTVMAAGEKQLVLAGSGLTGTGNDAGNLLVSVGGGNTLVGGAGLDTFVSGIGADTMQGGAGLDYVDYSASPEAVQVNMVTGVNHGGNAEGDVLSGIEVVFGSNYGDLLTTDGNNHYLFGGGGNDTLVGGANNNRLYGGEGDDSITGGSGIDLLDGGTGNDTMAGGLGNDVYAVDSLGDVVMENANEGTDLVQASISYTLGANLENLTLLGSTGLTGTGNELANVIQGSAGNDSILGLGGNDDLRGNLGDDTLDGGEGNDALYGGDGQDSLLGGIGNDVLHGDAGNDTLLGGDGADTLIGGTGADSMAGGAGDDTYYVDDAGDIVTELANEGRDTAYVSASGWTVGANVDVVSLSVAALLTGNADANQVIGSAGNDTVYGLGGNDDLRGYAGNDVLDGGEGNDALYGGDGQDSLLGGIGNDTLRGEAGNDTLAGGAGDDLLLGGAGADLFVWGMDALGGKDVVSDFSRADGDRLDLSALGVAQVATHTGAGQFTLTYYASTQATAVSVWSAGNAGAAADLTVTVYAAGTGQLTGSDFRL